MEEPVFTLAIDVSEQPIERLIKNQKAYYSGKKTPHDKSPTHNLRVDARYSLRGDGQRSTA
jgi:hypothetical protein